jgi:anaerobic magnesium-protoporphyrin IX monomethyl ester cyclase
MRTPIQKVLLIQPPAFTNRAKDDHHPYPPLGLGYVASYLEKHGFEVRIIDAFVEGWDVEDVVRTDRLRVGLPFDEIERRVRAYQPDLVGVSSMFTVQSRNAHAIYELVKRVDPEIVTVAGGNHATATAAESLNDHNLDFVILGEGEVALVDLIRVLDAGGPLAGTKALAYRDGDRAVVSPDRNFIDDLDELPFPARHLLPMEKYIKAGLSHGGYLRRGRYTPVLTSRGCPAKCTFCSISIVSGRKYRFRSPQNVVEELQQVIRDYGIEEVLFEDDNLTLNIPRAEKLFDAMIEADLGLIWNTPNGVAAFALTPTLIEKMKRAGCYRINLAIESGNEDVLRNIIKKPLKLERVAPLVQHVRKVGIEVGAFLVVGMPGETLAQVRDSFRFVKNLKIFTPHVSIATPYPGTEMYELCVEKGYLVPGFSYDNLSIQYANIRTPDWTPQELEAVFEREQFLLRLHQYVRDPVALLRVMAGQVRRDPLGFAGTAARRVRMLAGEVVTRVRSRAAAIVATR